MKSAQLMYKTVDEKLKSEKKALRSIEAIVASTVYIACREEGTSSLLSHAFYSGLGFRVSGFGFRVEGFSSHFSVPPPPDSDDPLVSRSMLVRCGHGELHAGTAQHSHPGFRVRGKGFRVEG